MAARKLTVYSPARAELVAFEKKYNTLVVDCTTPKGMKSAKDCRKEIRDARSNLEDLRKETKEPALAKCKQVDSEAKAIKEKLDALFTKFDGAIKAIENKAEVDAQKALEEAADKIKELDAREQAIFDKEVELGLRDAPEEPEHTDTIEDSDASDSVSGSDNSTDSTSSASHAASVIDCASPEYVETICEPHIKVAAERLKVLKEIRGLVESTDAQPDGRIDKDIAAAHDATLADIWELCDVYK